MLTQIYHLDILTRKSATKSSLNWTNFTKRAIFRVNLWYFWQIMSIVFGAVKTQKLKVCHSLYQYSWKGWVKTRGIAQDLIKGEIKGIRLTTFFLLKATISEGDWSRSVKNNTIETKETHREILELKTKGPGGKIKETQLKLFRYSKFNQPISAYLKTRLCL